MVEACIKEIEWLDEDILEAEVLIEINKNTYWTFVHPCNFKVNDIVNIDFEIISLDFNEKMFFELNMNKDIKVIPDQKNRTSYICYGVIKKIHPMIIDIGDFSVDFGDWCNDNSVIDKYVYFTISRLDIIS